MLNKSFHWLENLGDSSGMVVPKTFVSNQNHNSSLLENKIKVEDQQEEVATLAQSEAEVWQGIKLEQEHKLAEAIKHYRQAVEFNSQSAVAHHILAIALKKQGNFTEADYYHRRAISLKTNNSLQGSETVAPRSESGSTIILPKLTAVSPGTYVENHQLEVAKIYLHQAKLYYAHQAWQKSIEACEQAIKICSDLPEIYKIYGNSLQQMGKIAEALGYYALALAKDPNLAEVYANIGSLYAKQTDWQLAVYYYQKALAIDPQMAKVCLHLARAWEKEAEAEKALESLLQALKLQPEILTVNQYLQLGADLLGEGKIQQAIACYESGTKLQPPAKEIYLKLIKVLEQDEQWKKAASYQTIFSKLDEVNDLSLTKTTRIANLLTGNHPHRQYLLPGKSEQQNNDSNLTKSEANKNQATADLKTLARQYLEQLKQQPNSSSIRLKLANLLALHQQWQPAITYYQQAIKIEPNLAIAYLKLGKIYVGLGKTLAGAELIYRGLSLEPEIVNAKQHEQLGDFWVKHHRYQPAMSCYRRAIQLQPEGNTAQHKLQQLIKPKNPIAEVKSLPSQENPASDHPTTQETKLAPKVQNYVNLAIKAEKEQNWQLAQQYYQQAVAIDPQNPQLQHNLGEVYSHQEIWNDAIKAYQKAIALKSNNSWTYHHLGFALLQTQQWQAAIDSFQRAIELKSDFVWSHYNLGEAFANLAMWDEALTAYKAAQQIDPDLPEAKTKIAKILHRRSEQDRQAVLTFCQTQLAQDPDNIELYHQAIALDNKDPQLYLGLAKALSKQEKFDQAIAIYQLGLKIQPKNLELASGLRAILDSSNTVLKLQSNQEPSSLPTNYESLQLPCHQSPLISIIIPVYNQIKYTFNCLRSLAQNISPELPIEVIVINDCSTDHTVAILESVIGLKRIDNTSNQGFLNSCNLGIAASQGEYIYLLNNDTELRPQALEKLLEVCQQDSQVGAVGSKLLYPDGSLQEAGGIIWQDGSGWNYGRQDNPLSPQYNYQRPVDYCSAASLLVRKSAFTALKGFDANFAPAYYEDTDLCLAIRHQLGLKVIYQPNSEVIHYEGVSCGTELNQGIKQYQSLNMVKFQQKWEAELTNYPLNQGIAGVASASRRHLGKNTILVIDTYAPCYDRESGARRLWQLMKIFKQLDFQVIFVPDNGAKEQPYVAMLQNLGIEVLYTEPGYGLAIEEQLTNLLPLVDLAWVCRPQLFEKYSPLIRRYDSIKLIYDTVDLHYLRLKRATEIGDRSMNQIREWVRMQLRELKAANEADLTITVTSLERDILQQQEVNHLAVIPNIHEAYLGQKPEFAERKGLLFIGSYNHPPNIDAVQWLVEEIMPLVWQEIPNLTVTLLGSNPSAAVMDLGTDSRIQVTGYIADVTPYFLEHRVFVAPLRYGAGMKGKIGQSLEYGLPIVSTSIGIEGMNLTHDKDVLEANKTAEFAQQILKLYQEETLWNKLAVNCSQAIAMFEFQKVKLKVQEFLKTLNIFLE